MTATKWETTEARDAREAARQTNGRFGSYDSSESSTDLSSIYQRYEDGVGGDLMSYMSTTARGMVSERSQTLSSIVDEEDLAMETFAQLHKQIVKEAQGLEAPPVESPKSLIRTMMDRRAYVLADTRRHWGNRRAGAKLNKRIEAFQSEHLRNPNKAEKNEMVQEVLAEVREETPASPAQENFETANRMKFSSIDAPASNDEDSWTISQTYHDADRNVEADPEDALIYGTLAQRAAVSSTVDMLTSTRIADRAEGAKSAMAALLPDHPITPSIEPGKRRNFARPVKQAGVRASIEANLGGEDAAPARNVFTPWPDADQQQKRKIAKQLNELSGGDDKRLAALWDKCLDAAIIVEDQE